MLKWSVGLVTVGDEIMPMERIVDLADAVAKDWGIATGVGDNHYGAQIIVTADTEEQAVARATDRFREAAKEAGLPEWPIERVEAISEDDDEA